MDSIAKSIGLTPHSTAARSGTQLAISSSVVPNGGEKGDACEPEPFFAIGNSVISDKIMESTSSKLPYVLHITSLADDGTVKGKFLPDAKNDFKTIVSGRELRR